LELFWVFFLCDSNRTNFSFPSASTKRCGLPLSRFWAIIKDLWIPFFVTDSSPTGTAVPSPANSCFSFTLFGLKVTFLLSQSLFLEAPPISEAGVSVCRRSSSPPSPQGPPTFFFPPFQTHLGRKGRNVTLLGNGRPSFSSEACGLF